MPSLPDPSQEPRGSPRPDEVWPVGEELARRMFEHSPIVQLLIDPVDGVIVDGTAAAARLYGYSCEELRQLNITALNTLPSEQVAVEMARAVAGSRNYFIFPHRLAT